MEDPRLGVGVRRPVHQVVVERSGEHPDETEQPGMGGRVLRRPGPTGGQPGDDPTGRIGLRRERRVDPRNELVDVERLPGGARGTGFRAASAVEIPYQSAYEPFGLSSGMTTMIGSVPTSDWTSPPCGPPPATLVLAQSA